MKKKYKFIAYIIASAFLILNIFQVNALSDEENSLDKTKYTQTQLNTVLSIKGLFTLYYNIIGEGAPKSYKYIKLNFKNIEANTPIYEALQKGVYYDLIKNKVVDLNLSRNASEGLFNTMLTANFGESFSYERKGLTLNKFLDIMQELKDSSLDNNNNSTTSNSYKIEEASNFPILNDVYLKLRFNHYNSASFNDEELLRGAIKGMADATGDKFTTYFPPQDAKNFNDELSGEFEGIGAQVDMEKAGILKIISPLPGSPAEKAGLKGGDQILKIDDLEITADMSLQDAVNKIKGPAGTSVDLTILRDTRTIVIKITRAKIILNYVIYKKLSNGDNYIQITIFGSGTYKDFSDVVEKIAKENPNAKTIIDLRNNPGGSLDEVAGILNFFVPKGLSVVNIKYKNFSTDMFSLGSDYNFLNKEVVVLLNSGSASASEIMAITMKDYLADLKIVGEKSYGKGSVQNLDGYSDSSSFKYTTAKWFSGKTKTGIDGVGITPDLELKLDEAQFKNGIDNQLDYAKRL